MLIPLVLKGGREGFVSKDALQFWMFSKLRLPGGKNVSY